MIASGRSSSRRRSETRNGHTSRANADTAASRYDVLDRSGEGTLFVVYRVRDKQTRSLYALKALKGAYSRHSRFAPEMLKTASATAKLRHPHLAALVESDREEGTVYIVEEWLPGGSLASRISRSSLNSRDTTSFAVQIADGLAALHDQNLLHGDIRPRQILFDTRGRAKLTDIGFASAFQAAEMELTDVHHDAVHYMAPERFDGEPASEGADIYALGVTLYRTLTGRVPFDGTSPLSIAMRHRNDEPIQPSKFNPGCTPELENVILRSLAKDPADRYASTKELLAELAPDRLGTPARATGISETAKPSEAPVDASAKEAPEKSSSSSLAGAATLSAAATAASTSAAAAALSSTPATTAAVGAGALPGAVSPPRGLSRTRSRTVSEPRVLGRSKTSSPTEATPPPADPPADSNGSFGDGLDDATRVRQARIDRRRLGKREMLGAFLAFFWLLLAGGLLFGVCYGAYMFWIKEGPPELEVPSYVGLNQTDAERLLVKNGLTMRVGKEVFDPKKPEGMVLGGEPPPGKVVRKGRPVVVTVSRGQKPISMPDFTELTLTQARSIINRHGMRLGQIAEQYHERVPEGYICGQYPEPGEMFRRSDPINLIISRGPQPSPEAPDPDSLPIAPSAPRLPDEIPTTTAPSVTADDTLVSRGALVSVALPAEDGPQEVKIVVRDSDGEYTAYQQTHAAGDVIDKPIQVVRPQGATALVRIYVGGKLQREIRI